MFVPLSTCRLPSIASLNIQNFLFLQNYFGNLYVFCISVNTLDPTWKFPLRYLLGMHWSIYLFGKNTFKSVFPHVFRSFISSCNNALQFHFYRNIIYFCRGWGKSKFIVDCMENDTIINKNTGINCVHILTTVSLLFPHLAKY